MQGKKIAAEKACWSRSHYDGGILLHAFTRFRKMIFLLLRPAYLIFPASESAENLFFFFHGYIHGIAVADPGLLPGIYGLPYYFQRTNVPLRNPKDIGRASFQVSL